MWPCARNQPKPWIDHTGRLGYRPKVEQSDFPDLQKGNLAFEVHMLDQKLKMPYPPDPLPQVLELLNLAQNQGLGQNQAKKGPSFDSPKQSPIRTLEKRGIASYSTVNCIY